MVKQQQTLKRAVSFSGVGIHTGNKVNMTWKPAPVDHGIKFVRADLERRPAVEPLAANLGDVTRWTTIQSGNVVVHTVEHVLAALSAFGIDNLLIELDGNEPPVADGSAKEFVRMIQEAGIQPQEGQRTVFAPQQPLYVQNNGALAIVLPCDHLQISCTIHYGKPGLDAQYFSLPITPESFETQVAGARTFAFFEDLHFLMDKGLIKGGSLENSVLIRNETILATEPLRYRDEFVRHKILDIVGDLALLGRPLAAHIVAIRPSHALNAELVRALTQQMEKEKPVAAVEPFVPPAPPVPNKEAALDIMRVLGVLPHRYPFLMVDRVLTLEADRVVALKNVTVNEPYFQGHFPGHPIMPGVLQLEAIAQVAGVLMMRPGENEGKVAYFMSANNVKWRKPVRPGDQLLIEVTMGKMRGRIGKANGVCKVGDEVVSEAEVMFTIVDK